MLTVKVNIKPHYIWKLNICSLPQNYSRAFTITVIYCRLPAISVNKEFYFCTQIIKQPELKEDIPFYKKAEQKQRIASVWVKCHRGKLLTFPVSF